MNTIYHDLMIKAPTSKVYASVSSPELLDEWWTETCKGEYKEGGEYELVFTQEYIWKAKVSKLIPDKEFELLMLQSDEDWDGTRVGFILEENGETTKLRFYHAGWKNVNEHYRTSSYCWACYLGILKNYIEKGTRVPYAERCF